MTEVCARCGSECDGSASITIGDTTRFYCHSLVSSCYVNASWNLRGACASVGIEHGKSTSQVLAEITDV